MNHFYDNTEGIRDEFAAAWGAVAERFAGRSEVAGYDIRNEPEVSRPAEELTPLYEVMLTDSIEAIRTAEEDADFDHVVIIEPAMPAADFSRGIVNPDPARLGVDPANIVFGPHNYAESITQGIPIEGMSAALVNVADDAGVPVWIGEYGFWNREPATLESIGRYAAEEDARVIGGTWWQWRQGCGDPHSVGWDTPAEGQVVHLNVVGCPGDVDLDPNEEFLSVLGRAFPRFSPGRISELSSDPATGRFVVEAGGAVVGEVLVVWTPTGADTHEVAGRGVETIEQHEVPGGRIVTATVTEPEYDLMITPLAG